MSGKFIINDIEFDNAPIDIVSSRKRYSKRVNIFGGRSQAQMSTNLGTNRQTVVMVFNVEDAKDMGDFVKLMSRLVHYPFAFINSHQLFREQIAEGDAMAGHPYKPIGNNFHMYGVEYIKLSQTAETQGVIFLELSLIYFNYIPFGHSLSFIATKNVSRLTTDIRNTIKGQQLKQKKEYFDVDSPASSDVYQQFFNDDWAVLHANISTADKNKSVYIKAPFLDTPKPTEGTEFREVKVMKDFATDDMKDISELFETKFVSWLNVNTLDGKADLNNDVTPLQSITVQKMFKFAEINLAAWQKPTLQYLGEGDISVDMQFAINTEYTNGLGEFDPLHAFHFLENKVDDNFAKHPKLQLFNHLKVDTFLNNAIDHFDFIIDRQQTVHSSSEQGHSQHRIVMTSVSPEYFANLGRYFQGGTKNAFFNEIGGDELLIQFYNRMQKIRSIAPVKTGKYIYHSAYDSQLAAAKQSSENIDMGDASDIYNDFAQLAEANDIKANAPGAMDELIYLARKNSGSDERLLLKLQNGYMRLIRMPATASSEFNALLIKHRKKVWDGQQVIIGKFRGEAYNDFTLARKAGINPVSIQNIKKIGNLSPFMFLRKSQYLTEPMLTAQYAEFLDWEGSQAVRILAKVAEQWSNKAGVPTEDIQNTQVELKDNGFNYDQQKTSASVQPDREGPFDFQSLIAPQKLRGMEGVVSDDRAMAFNEDLGAVLQLEGMAGPFNDSLKHAFPVLKVYLVRQMDTDLAFTDIPQPQFFELKGIGDVSITTPTEQNPVGVAVIEISNPGNIYTHIMDLFTKNKPKLNPSLRHTENSLDITIDKLQLEVGHMLHIRGGYSNDINKLETIFNGQISSIEGTEVLQIIAETYGRELIAVEHGDDPDQDNFWFHSDTESVIGEALAAEEIENFGETVWDMNPFNGLDEKDQKAQRLQFLRSRIYMNVFASSVEEVDSEFQGVWNSIVNTFTPNKTAYYQFSIYKMTPWDMLREMQFRHPNTISRALNYGHRQTYFFGIKEQLYLAKDIAKETMDESFYETPFFDIFDDNEEAKKYQQQTEALRYKPVSQVHLATSETNIIFNNMRVTDEFNTAVRVAYYEDQEDIKDSSYEYLTMQLDDNLRSSSIRLGEIYGGGIHKKFMAYRYGVEYLRSEVEKMYDGTIRLIGNSRIKAGDHLYVYDTIRGLTGLVKVREATHHFQQEMGFVTDVTPGLFAEANEVTYSTLFQRLMATAVAACHSIRPRIIEKYATGAEFNIMNLTSEMSQVYGKAIENQAVELFGEGGLYAGGQALAFGGASYQGLQSMYRLMGYSSSGSMIQNAVVQGKNSIKSLAQIAQKTQMASFAGLGGVGRQAWQMTRTLATATGQLAKLDMAAAARSAGQLIRLRPMISTAWAGTRLAFGAGAAVAGTLTAPGVLAFLALYGVGTIAVEAFVQTFMFGLKTRQPVRIYPIKMNGVQYTGGIVGYKDNGLFESFYEEGKKTVDDLGKILDYFSADAQVDLQ